ncbi:MAG: MFS transporter [Schumannella sp.]
MLGLFTTVSSSMIVVNALPAIASGLGTTSSGALWVVLASLVTMTIATPVWGKLADHLDKKRLTQASILIFVVASIGAALAPGLGALVAMRALQGVATGGLLAMSQATLGAITTPRQRGAYSGYLGAVMSVATLCGPLIGGIVVDIPGLGWRWCFLLLLPLAVAGLVIVQLTLRAPATRAPMRVDLAETIGMLRNRTTLWAIVGSVSLGLVTFSSVLFLSQYLQLGRGYSASTAGILAVPMLSATLVASIVAGHLVARRGRVGGVLLGGSVLMAAGFAALATVGVSAPDWLAIVATIPVGAGIGMLMQNFVLAAQNALDHLWVGRVSATLSFVRSLAGAAGVAGLGAIVAGLAGADPEPAAQARATGVVFAIAAFASLAALVAAFALRGQRLRGTI